MLDVAPSAALHRASVRVHTEATRMLLRRSGVPVVEMWDAPADPIDSAVGFSNVSAAREMVRYLAEKGHQPIGLSVARASWIVAVSIA